MAFVKIMTESQKGQKFLVDRDEVVIGRAPDNVVRLDSPSVSGKHCAILREGRKYTVRDLDSTNGTFLNDLRITEYRLSPKDVVRVGAVEMMFDGDDIAVDQNASVRTTILPIAAVRPGAATHLSSEVGPSPFNARKDAKRIWTTIVWLVAVVTLGALCLFFYQLSNS